MNFQINTLSDQGYFFSSALKSFDLSTTLMASPFLSKREIAEKGPLIISSSPFNPDLISMYSSSWIPVVTPIVFAFPLSLMKTTSPGVPCTAGALALEVSEEDVLPEWVEVSERVVTD